MKKRISVSLHPAAVAMILLLGLCGTAAAITGDLDSDNYVDWNDLDAFTDRWLNTGCSAADWCGGADIDHSSKVDFNDFGLFALHWLESEFVDHNLVGWWKFDEGSGTDANDSSEYGNDGTLYGDPNWVTGNIGASALDFDGADDYVKVANNDSLNIPGELTISAWVKADGSPGDRGIVFKGGTLNDQRYKLTFSDGHLYFERNTNDGYKKVRAPEVSSSGVWLYVVGVYDGTYMKVYENCIEKNSSNVGSNTVSYLGQPLVIGINKYHDAYFDGIIDDVRIYNRALTAGEIWQLLNRKAGNPYPADGAVDVDPEVILSWSAGKDALSHDVYLGTNYNDVNDADISDPNVYMGNQTATSYDPNGLEYETAYYWRIDEVNDSNDRCKGDVWSFTTIGLPGQASNPNPSDSATEVSVFVDLSWTAGSHTTSHDVYFGTDSTPDSGEFQGNQPGTTFDAGTMDANTTYYWRIDEKNAASTTTGEVWSFTTLVEFDLNLVGWWKFDEGSGTDADDSSGYGNHGTLYGDPNWVAGMEGIYALDFDADGDYVNVPDTDDSLDVDSNITIAAWVKLNSTDAAALIVGKQPSGTAADNYPGNYAFMTVAGGKLRLAHQTSTGIDFVYYESTTAVGAGDWDHAAVTLVEGGTVEFYIDGSPAGTTAQTTTFGIVNDEPVRIGVKKNMVTWFNGKMDDVRIYDRALTDEEIEQVYLEELSKKAFDPYPTDEAVGVDPNVILSWSAGRGAVSHDVYFGTDYNDVNDADISDPNVYMSNQEPNSWDPNGLDPETAYYWRIDEVNDSNDRCKGDVWSFTTIGLPGQASNPNPSDLATEVGVFVDLSWTAGSDTTSHDVYFGTDSTPDSGEFQGNRPSTRFDPGIMDVSTTYYWRIDEKNASGTTTGVVWSFTTGEAPAEPSQANMPYPSDGAADTRTTTAYLSWKAGSGATSRDVYFGTNPTPGVSEFQGNQISTTFKPGAMAEGVTYYWRIDEKNAGGTITGDVWSFTTSVFPDVADLEWSNVLSQPWDSPDRLDHFDDFITANGAHPRLLLTQADVNDLKSKITSGMHEDIWLLIKNKADGYLGATPNNNPGDESATRSDGDVPPWLAMAYLMTDNTAYLNKAVSWMTTVCNYSEWDGNGSLGAGHCLMGVSLAFDWLYNDMTPTQRNTILNGSSGTRGLTYFANQMANGSPTHSERYLSNHCQVEYGGLAAAGFALYGEVTAAEGWLRKAYNIFNAAFRVCGNDGSSTEGHNYYGLMTEFQMHFNKMAKQLLGRDFYDESEWLRNMGNFILYSNLPDFSSDDNIMRYGDTSTYTYGSHGPVYQMFNVASEYNEPYFQWLALEMFDRAIGTGDRMGWSCLLWYDDTIASTTPSDGNLPTYRHFESTGWITSRSGWDADAVMVGFKCGPFHGHAVQALYDEMITFHQIVNGHGHPDVQHFNVYAYGQRLATDDAYSKPKWTYYHSTMLAGTGTIGASGQLGDTYTSDSSWFDREEVFNAGATSAIIKAESTTEYDYIVGDAENIYREHFDNGGNLTKFLRHFIYIKPDIVVIVDELGSNSTVSGYYRWRMRYEGSASGSGNYYTVSNSDVRMDTHFVHTQSISTSVSGTYILANFDSTGSDLLVTVLHPRRSTDSACTIDYSSIVGTDIELTITTASGTISVDIDLAAQEVTIY